ncbi:MAG: SH3 domain-containing protein [Microcoleus sp. SIO2G3]|nr:SH3 domain-containing protein [Microcoleus sp. SIO2G3]
MSHWGIPITLLALALSAVGDTKAIATSVPNTSSANLNLEAELTQSQQKRTFQVAQGLVGQCRAASRSIFVYRERSTASPTRALEPNEQVVIAEEDGRGGWIAISSPIRGFVEARDLKRCSEAPEDVVTRPRPPRSEEVVTRPRPLRSSLCRQVTYQGLEGVVIREQPNIYSRPLSTVFFEEPVTLNNPPQSRVDNEGREWVRLTSPVIGWMSNGFPATGDLNLRACF